MTCPVSPTPLCLEVAPGFCAADGRLGRQLEVGVAEVTEAKCSPQSNAVCWDLGLSSGDSKQMSRGRHTWRTLGMFTRIRAVSRGGEEGGREHEALSLRGPPTRVSGSCSPSWSHRSNLRNPSRFTARTAPHTHTYAPVHAHACARTRTRAHTHTRAHVHAHTRTHSPAGVFPATASAVPVSTGTASLWEESGHLLLVCASPHREGVRQVSSPWTRTHTLQNRTEHLLRAGPPAEDALGPAESGVPRRPRAERVPSPRPASPVLGALARQREAKGNDLCWRPVLLVRLLCFPRYLLSLSVIVTNSRDGDC